MLHNIEFIFYNELFLLIPPILIAFVLCSLGKSFGRGKIDGIGTIETPCYWVQAGKMLTNDKRSDIAAAPLYMYIPIMF